MRSGPIAATFLVIVAGTACALGGASRTPDDGCPRSVAEAAALDGGEDLVLATGVLIRFVPAPDPDFRGYDVNLVARNGVAFHETLFLRSPTRIPGVSDGDWVLVVGERTDRSLVVEPGRCPAVTTIAEDEANDPWRDDPP